MVENVVMCCLSLAALILFSVFPHTLAHSRAHLHPRSLSAAVVQPVYSDDVHSHTRSPTRSPLFLFVGSWERPDDSQADDDESPGHISLGMWLAIGATAIAVLLVFGVAVVLCRKREWLERCRGGGGDHDLEGASYSYVDTTEENHSENEADQWFSRFLGANDELVSSDDE
jgi:hypothetical protein